MSGPSAFSDYVVFVDESGDHSLASIDPQYPVFVLTFCVFRVETYIDVVTPAVRRLKFSTFGHDQVVLHEHDIRKRKGAFARLGREASEAFLEGLTEVMAAAPFDLIAVVIDKRGLSSIYTQPEHPYHLAMKFGLERLHGLMTERGQQGRLTRVLCEARGRTEDEALELHFRRICDGGNYRGVRLPFELIVCDKKTNAEGLQIADLSARPIGLSVLRPDQSNRAFEVLVPKFRRDARGNYRGAGLKCFP